MASFASRPRIGSRTAPASVSPLTSELVRAVLVKPDLRRNRSGEQRKAAGDQARVSTMGPHGLDQGAAAGRERDARRDDLVDDADRQALNRATRSRRAGSKAISPFIARSVMAETSAFRPTIIGEFVDAFLPDHGGIHIGEKEALAALGDGLDHEVDRLVCDLGPQARLDDGRQNLRMREKVGCDSACQDGMLSFMSERSRGPCYQRVGDGRMRRVCNKCRDHEILGRCHRGGPFVSNVGIDAILIAGPTASGKSALAIELAKALGGMVINADSMQVYGDLRIITARPSVEDEAEAPHRLFGHVDAGVNFSVGRYVADAVSMLDLYGATQLPIFVGGTGLYFKALTEGLSDMPNVPDEVREFVRRESEGVETPALHRWLSDRDPETASRLRPSDRLRIQRALEIVAATGRSLASFHGARRPGPLAGRRVCKVFLSPERDELRQRIDHRFVHMMKAGRARRGEGACGAKSRSDASRHARPRGAGPAGLSARRNQPGGSGGEGARGHAPLFEAAIHVVPAPACGLGLGDARGGVHRGHADNQWPP